MLRWPILLLLLFASNCTAGSGPDIQDLSRLPLNKLLTMKKTLITRAVGSESGGNVTDASAEALPWSGHRGGGGGSTVWIEDPPWTGGGGGWHSGGGGGGKGKKKLQGIFHGTISILAFLAFAAYVICMVLQAFKAKKALTMTLASTVEPEISRRGLPTTGAATADELYAALRRLAEGYARYAGHCSKERCP